MEGGYAGIEDDFPAQQEVMAPRRGSTFMANPMATSGRDGGDLPVAVPTDALRAFQAAHAAELAKKEELEESNVASKKAGAEKELDHFYEERTDKRMQRAATNREHEANEAASRATIDVTAADGNPYERVLSMIDTQMPSPAKRCEASTPMADLSRMRGLLIQLKNDPPSSFLSK